ncbi:MAG: GNAT family protein [Bryobacteraceae bacterium]
MTVEPLTLEGRSVRLEPLSLDHLPGLCQVGLDEELWRWTPNFVRTPADLKAYVEGALRGQADGSVLPFATVELATGQVIGSTRYLNIDRVNLRLEIGATWIAKPWQRTAMNTEAKYLMLRHGFESLGAMRMELKTDSLNERSRRAILRLGAKEEGTLRKHMVTDSGRIRHTVYYSILDEEWPAVKARLERILNGASNSVIPAAT